MILMKYVILPSIYINEHQVLNMMINNGNPIKRALLFINNISATSQYVAGKWMEDSIRTLQYYYRIIYEIIVRLYF